MSNSLVTIIMQTDAATSAAANVSDTIKEEAVDVVMRLAGEDDIKLDKEDEFIVSIVYSEAKAVAEPILQHTASSVSVKVTKLLAALMKIMEKTKVNGSKIPGSKKKAVALYLLRQLTKDLVADIPLQSYLLSKAAAIGEQMLETLVDLTHGMNIPEVATTCCTSLISSLIK